MKLGFAQNLAVLNFSGLEEVPEEEFVSRSRGGGGGAVAAQDIAEHLLEAEGHRSQEQVPSPHHEENLLHLLRSVLLQENLPG